MSEETERRKQAWETRRKKYGQNGHSRGAYGHSGDHVASMQALLIRLHVEGTLSEGQVSKATGLHRITVRKMADEYTNSFSMGWGSHSDILSPMTIGPEEFLR